MEVKRRKPTPAQRRVLGVMADGSPLTSIWDRRRRTYRYFVVKFHEKKIVPVRRTTAFTLEERYGWIAYRNGCCSYITPAGRAAAEGGQA